MKSVVVDPSAYDWEGDRRPNTPASRTVIYEMHVRGFTRHASAAVSPEARGTYAGLVEKIPYLRDLGITAVELLPVFQFDPTDAPNGVNYWGISRCRSSRRITAIPRPEIRSPCWTSSGTW